MYFDHRPCQVCGAQVRLRPREGERGVAEPDATVDERICTNAGCATHRADRSPDAPTP